MKLSEHFTLEEFTASQTAARAGIPNIPGESEIAACRELCIHVLEPLRAATGRPIIISSGYRAPAVNKLVGGSPTSAHMRGGTADITCPGIPLVELANTIIKLGLPFDQCILEYSQWLHVGILMPKREILTAIKEGGKTIYRKGI